MEPGGKKKIPKSRWPDYFARLTDGNKGRLIRVSRFEGESEQKTLEEELPFIALSYDPHHEGMLSISAGEDRIEYEHAVQHPDQIWVDEDTEGRAKTMQITDADGNRTVVTFEE
jgi:hypothetical protein